VLRSFPIQDRDKFQVLKKLNSPAKVQDFLDSLPLNFEKRGATCRSPLLVLRHKEAYCIEGAMLAAAVFWYHGQKPLLLDLRTSMDDVDHVVALFKENGHWGAVSKTNHTVLRYRDPIYKTVRELALSYFNEYFLDSGKKTLRTYSAPFDLRQFGADWLTNPEALWPIPKALDESRHHRILQPRMIRRLRSADAIEIQSGKITEWRY
jgi:hypothetical protein